MPLRKSNGGNKITTLRRSPRFLPPEDASDKEPQIWKNQVCSPRNLAKNKTHSRAPLSSLENTLTTNTLRRSPRFLPRENSSGNAATRNPKSGNNRVCSLSNASAVKIHSDSILSPRRTATFAPKEKGVESLPNLRRSARFSNKENAPASVDTKAGDKQAELLVSRQENDSSDKEVTSEVTQKENLGKIRSINVEVQRVFTEAAAKAEKGVNSSYEFGKCRKGINGLSSTVSQEVTPKGRRGKNRKDSGNEEIRIDRKRKRDEDCSPQGWTKEQETALRRAFIAAKPSPRFWKKVSKLMLQTKDPISDGQTREKFGYSASLTVPGKSAQECFDKVHSDLITPLPRPLSRAKRTNSSPLSRFSVSGSKLLEPTEKSVKRQKSSKQKSRLTQETVRHLLRKHYLVEGSSEVDLFSCQKDLASPPVLKQVKNISLHEKYIDQLHCREARRTAASSHAAKHITGYNGKENQMQKWDLVKTARNALVSDAVEMINEFKHLQTNGLSNNDDYEEDECDELP